MANATLMDTAKALAIVVDIASRWGENAEEGFCERIQAETTDEDCAAMATTDGKLDEDELEEIKTVRDLWGAIETVTGILEQRGLEHYGRDCHDGKLTTLIDTIVFG